MRTGIIGFSWPVKLTNGGEREQPFGQLNDPRLIFRRDEIADPPSA